MIYEMCPHCMNQLIERKQPIDDGESINYCPKCGKKMVMACFGEHKIDDTIYKIILNDVFLSHNRDKFVKFLSTLIKIGNLDFNAALEKCRAKDSMIFEGNISDTYVNMGLLDDFAPDIHYTVVPPFPFESLITPFVSLCPICGNETIHKSENLDDPKDYVRDGYFCEKCQDWVVVTEMPKEDDDMEMLRL